MAHTAPVKKEFAPVSEGSHVARLYQIIRIGTVPSTFKGVERQVDQVRLTFELCNELQEFKQGEGEKPRSISTRYETYSMGKKANLRKLVEGILGTSLDDEEAAGFNLDNLLGEDCLLTVVHDEGRDGNTYANIKNASPLPKGMTAPAMVNEPKFLDVNEMTDEEFRALPQFLQDKIGSSREWRERHGIKEPTVHDSDDIPFE